MTVVGTRTCPVLLLDKLTVKAEVVAVLRETVPVAAFAPAASLKVLGLTLKVKVGAAGTGVAVGTGVGVAAVSLSVTVTRTRPGTNPATVAVKPTT